MTKVAVIALSYVSTVTPACLTGASLICDGIPAATEDASRGTDEEIIASTDAAIRDALPSTSSCYLIELGGRQDCVAKSLPACEGIGW